MAYEHGQPCKKGDAYRINSVPQEGECWCWALGKWLAGQLTLAKWDLLEEFVVCCIGSLDSKPRLAPLASIEPTWPHQLERNLLNLVLPLADSVHSVRYLLSFVPKPKPATKYGNKIKAAVEGKLLRSIATNTDSK